MKRIIPSLVGLGFGLVISCSALFPQTAESLRGVWENRSRFVEFSADNRMRIVLKPYYAFVYEDTLWMPCTSGDLEIDTPPSDSVHAVMDQPAVSAEHVLVPGAFVLSIRYKGEKKDAQLPAAIIGNSLYFRFYRKAAVPEPVLSAATSGDAAIPSATVISTGSAGAGNLAGVPAKTEPLDGFWISCGNADALRLYRSEPVREFFCYYFSGSAYYRIRYWADDVRYRTIFAQFTAQDGKTLSVPKFIYIKGTLYTCITSTGKILRNFESGTFTVKDGAISFRPTKIAYSGTAAAVMKPVPFSLSADCTILGFGEPYLVRSKVTDLSAEIKAHNALRRPPRKPIFELMKLDFYWDEIERIRNNGMDKRK